MKKCRCDNCLNIVEFTECNYCCNGEQNICPVCKYCINGGYVVGYDMYTHEIRVIKLAISKASKLKYCESSDISKLSIMTQINLSKSIIDSMRERIKKLRSEIKINWS